MKNNSTGLNQSEKSKSYSELLKDPRWQKKRLQIFKRDKFKCSLCGDVMKTLHVHHKSYEYGRDPWDYSNDNLVTVCEDCHLFIETCKDNNSSYEPCNKVLKLEIASGDGFIIIYSTKKCPFAYAEFNGKSLRFVRGFETDAAELILKYLKNILKNGKEIH